MASNNDVKRPVGKRFVVTCDGTWNNSDMGIDQNQMAPPVAQIPSNVTRIARALAHRDQNGIPQIAFYQRGVGTDSDLEDKLLGGLTGNDVAEHIREAYGFLANNFDPESQADLDDVSKPIDEIVIFGFSRGAFTARAISSLISDIGLLTKLGMESFWGIFGDWMKQDVQGEESAWFQTTYGRKIPFTDPSYRETLIKEGLTRWGMPIRGVGVWDTVGALGIPLPFGGKNVKEFSFVNTKVARQVQHAFHAVAIDEHRNLFSPTLWEQPTQPNQLKVLKQCWFPGVHSNIGGSYPDAGISNITLAWMVSQFEDNDGGILAFNSKYLDWVQDTNTQGYLKNNVPVRPWGMGKLYNSAPMNSAVAIVEGMAPITRTPGRYNRVDNTNGLQTKQRLVGTGESIHSCVRVRIQNGGLATEDDPDNSKAGKLFSMVKHAVGMDGHVGKYNSPALTNYDLVRSDGLVTNVKPLGKGPSGYIWRAKDGLEPLHEDELGATEIRLMKRSAETASL